MWARSYYLITLQMLANCCLTACSGIFPGTEVRLTCLYFPWFPNYSFPNGKCSSPILRDAALPPCSLTGKGKWGGDCWGSPLGSTPIFLLPLLKLIALIITRKKKEKEKHFICKWGVRWILELSPYHLLFTLRGTIQGFISFSSLLNIYLLATLFYPLIIVIHSLLLHTDLLLIYFHILLPSWYVPFIISKLL